jgi:hypothetical protein
MIELIIRQTFVTPELKSKRSSINDLIAINGQFIELKTLRSFE